MIHWYKVLNNIATVATGNPTRRSRMRGRKAGWRGTKPDTLPFKNAAEFAFPEQW